MNHSIRPRKITDEEFIRAWKGCESIVQTARRLGIHHWTVAKRAARLRAQGVELPKQEVAP